LGVRRKGGSWPTSCSQGEACKGSEKQYIFLNPLADMPAQNGRFASRSLLEYGKQVIIEEGGHPLDHSDHKTRS
jgi:hypothetical protein